MTNRTRGGADDDLLKANDVAAWLTISTQTLHAWAAEAEAGRPRKGPPHYRFGRRRLWRVSDVREWIESTRVG